MLTPVPVRAGDGAAGEPPLLSSTVLAPILVWSVIAGIVLLTLRQRGIFSFEAIRRAPRRRPEFIGSMVWLGLAFGVYFLMQVGAGIGAAVASFLEISDGSLEFQALASWAAYTPAFLAIGVLVILAGKLLSRAGVRGRAVDLVFGAGAYLLSFPIITATLLIASLAATLLRGVTLSPISHDTLGLLFSADRTIAWWVMVGAVVIAAPIVEEFIYRGCLQSAILGATKSHAIAIMLTAAVFAAAHIGSVRAEALAGLFVLGLAFGLVFERTGRVGSVVVMHAIFNAANLIQAIVFA